MTEIVVVSGNPRPGSRTRALAVAVGDAFARRRAAAPPTVVDLGEYGYRLLVADDADVTGSLAAVRAAGLLVVATPTYKGSYTGVLKVFLDYLPQAGLAGITAAPVTVGAAPAQAEASLRHLRGLLTELGADVLPGLAVVESRLTEPDLAAGYVEQLAGAAR